MSQPRIHATINSKPEGIGLRHAFLRLLRQSGDRARYLEPDIGVELARQRGVEIMAGKLGLRPVDHANRALQARVKQSLAQLGRLRLAQVDKEFPDSAVPAQALVAVAMRRADLLDLHLAVPIRGSRYRAAIGAKSDQRRLLAEAVAAELADIDLFANEAHFRRRRVADM